VIDFYGLKELAILIFGTYVVMGNLIMHLRDFLRLKSSNLYYLKKIRFITPKNLKLMNRKTIFK